MPKTSGFFLPTAEPKPTDDAVVADEAVIARQRPGASFVRGLLYMRLINSTASGPTTLILARVEAMKMPRL
jgi:hypothetical protein